MAREDFDGIPVPEPKADVYLALLVITSISLIAAVTLMWLELGSLGSAS